MIALTCFPVWADGNGSRPMRDAFSQSDCQWKPLTPYSRLLEVGAMYDGSYINVNIARDMALLSADGTQFISYYDPDGYLVVAQREWEDACFDKHRLPVGQATPEFLANPHHFSAMQIDGDGYLHMVFGHHNSPLKYLKSTYPYDASQWNLPATSMTDADEEKKVTYVRFIKLPSGNLLAMYRVGGSGVGYSRLLAYDVKTQRWSVRHSPFVTDQGESSPYFWRPAVSKDGVIHLLWTWRLAEDAVSSVTDRTSDGFLNKDIAYAWSDDEGRTWKRSDGSAYTMPIQRRPDGAHTAEVVEPVGVREGFFNHYGSYVDNSGRPHFVYSRWENPDSKVSQQWHLYRDRGSWHKARITDYGHRVEWTRAQQRGRASTYMARPSIVVADDGTAVVLSRSRELGDHVEIYLSEDPAYRSWQKRTAFDGSVGGWEPQMDLDRWRQSQRLDVLIVGVTDSDVYRGLSGNRKKKPWYRRLFDRESDDAIEILAVDERLKENIGYLLEIDYAEMKRAVHGN